MQLSRKEKTFSKFFAAFLKYSLHFKHFEKKMTLMAFLFPKLRTPKTWVDKFLKSPVSEGPWKSNMANVPKHCWNLHRSIFIIFIDYFEVNWVGKSIFEVTDSENVAWIMSKKSRLRGCFDRQYGKRAQALLKYASQHPYYITWLLQSQLSWKKSLLLTCEIFGLLVNALAADEMYPVFNRDNLTIPIQMQLSQKQNTFSEFLAAFFKYSLTFEDFEEKMTVRAFVFRKLRTPKSKLDKCLKSLVSGQPSTSNMAGVPKHCWNLHHSIFMRFTDPCQINRVRKSLSYWHAKSWDCLLTHWLLNASILFLLEKL